MNAKIIVGLILVGTAIIFSIQNTAVMDISFLFWKLSTSTAFIMGLMLAIGLFLGLLLQSSFSKTK